VPRLSLECLWEVSLRAAMASLAITKSRSRPQNQSLALMFGFEIAKRIDRHLITNEILHGDLL